MKGSGRGDPLITVGGQFTGGGLLAGGEADISVRPDQEDARSVAQRRLILGAVRRLRGRRELDQPHEISPSAAASRRPGSSAAAVSPWATRSTKRSGSRAPNRLPSSHASPARKRIRRSGTRSPARRPPEWACSSERGPLR